MKKAIVTSLLVFSIAIASFAQDINGKWTGRIMDQFDIAYIFKADGEKLTGTTTGPDGNVIEIKNGKITGDAIEFVIDIMGNDTKVTGVIAGETLTLKLNAMGNDIEILLKKEVK